MNCKCRDYQDFEWILLVGDAFQWPDLCKCRIVVGVHTRREIVSLSDSISCCTEKSVLLCYVGDSQFISFSPTQHYIFTREHRICSELSKFQHYVFFTKHSLQRGKHILTDGDSKYIKLAIADNQQWIVINSCCN